MRYHTTRNHNLRDSFEDVVFKGLGGDGGLYIPEFIPKLNLSETNENVLFTDVAFEVFRLYISESEINDNDLKMLVLKSFSTFTVPEVTPLYHITNNIYVLELFHGPTCAFKDIALQFLGNLFEFFLERKNQQQQLKITVVGATSGDTGGAAIYGLKGKKNIDVFILHPKDRISNVQKMQMCTIMDPNIYNIEVNGTFDDCQDIVKELFKDINFRNEYNLAAINSINWARILAQISYYVYSHRKICNGNNNIKIRYVVPTGNFGDILAGFYAKRMGLEIDKLIIATNENNVLHEFLETGIYTKKEVKETDSPAMDISVSSNFERLLWYLSSTEDVINYMTDLKENGEFSVNNTVLSQARAIFGSCSVSDNDTRRTIQVFYDEKKYILDPHTAVGIFSSINTRDYSEQSGNDIDIVIGTASPGKFPETVLSVIMSDLNKNKNNNNKKILSFNDIAPARLQNLELLPLRLISVPIPNTNVIKNIIKQMVNLI